MSLKVSHDSLAATTAKAIAAAIDSGRLRQRLPPERQLSRQLGVSRPVLRSTLRTLEAKGLLSPAAGRNGRTILQHKKRNRRPSVAREVFFLQSSLPFDQFNENLRTQEFLAENLSPSGTSFHVTTLAEPSPKRLINALDKTVAASPDAVWIIHLAPQEVQQWFQDRALPTILLGSPQEGISLPSIDEDYGAACRHAAGMFLARGHSRLALLKRHLQLVGDAISSNAFTEGAKLQPDRNIDIIHDLHDSTVTGICKAVDRLLAHPKCPTGWLIVSARTYFTVASHLMTKGIHPGKQISLICRDADPYFEVLLPSVAHYRRDVQKKNSLLLKLLQATLRREAMPHKSWLLESTFHDGASLSPVLPHSEAHSQNPSP